MSSLIITALIAQAAGRYGLEPKLLRAIAMQESSLRPNVVSHTGDIGLMQVSPRTARAFNCGDVRPVRANIECAARYLAHLKKAHAKCHPRTWHTFYHSRNDVLRFRYKLALSRHMPGR